MTLFRVIVTCMVSIVIASMMFAVATSLLGAPIPVTASLLAAAALALGSGMLARRRRCSELDEAARIERSGRRLRAVILSEVAEVRRITLDEERV